MITNGKGTTFLLLLVLFLYFIHLAKMFPKLILIKYAELEPIANANLVVIWQTIILGQQSPHGPWNYVYSTMVETITGIWCGERSYCLILYIKTIKD